MTNLKIVKNYNLPPWADLGTEYGREYTYSVTVAFTGKENGTSVKPTYVGMNPFDESFALSVGGFKIELFDPSTDATIGVLYTTYYGSGHGVRQYDITKMYSEDDTIVFDVLQLSGLDDESVNPDKIIMRELTEQEKTYTDKVLEQNLSFMADRRDELK